MMLDCDVLHVFPINDLIEHELSEDACVCGPSLEIIPREERTDAHIYTHHSLDGREANE